MEKLVNKLKQSMNKITLTLLLFAVIQISPIVAQENSTFDVKEITTDTISKDSLITPSDFIK